MLVFVLGLIGLTALSWTVLAIYERLSTPERSARGQTAGSATSSR